MDEQIGKYMKHLKDNNLYDNSLIVIAADHHAHAEDLGIKDEMDRDLPLFIINGNIDNKKAYHGNINQLDVFTTVLDIMGINSSWHGLGYSILSPHFSNSVSSRASEISRLIIEGNYFSEK